jgi:ATP-binding cassette subfamily B protein/ATP-binding cassette subfamily C protein
MRISKPKLIILKRLILVQIIPIEAERMIQPPIWVFLGKLVRYAPVLYTFDGIFWALILILPVIPGLLLKEFFDGLTGSAALNLDSRALIALLVAVGGARVLSIFAGRLTKTQHRFSISSLIRHNLLAGILDRPGALPLTQTQTDQSVRTLSQGEVISYFREDVTQIEDNVAWTNELLGEGLFALIALGILLSIHARITLLVFLPLVFMVIVVERAQFSLKRYRRAHRQATQQVTGLISEMFRAVQAIKIAGAEPWILSHFQQLNLQRRQAALKDQLLTALLNSVFENLTSLGIGLLLLLMASGVQTGAKPLTVGDFALFVYYLAYVSSFVLGVGGFLSLSKQSEVSFERMQNLLPGSEAAFILVSPQPLYLPNLWGHTPPLPALNPDRGEHSQPAHLEQLEVRHLSYHYPGTDQGITSAQLKLKRGSLTVITGRIGSGKTTLLRTILGLLPKQAGLIYWNHQLIEDPAQFFVPPHTAYTPQVPQLFSQSLRENLLLGLECSDLDLETALQMAVFETDLAHMPQGLETVIGSQGVRLSGGQIQRVAAARMLIRRPELLVFDDLSSALDVETERLLWSRLFALRQGDSKWTPTFLVVSHRPFVLAAADQVLVMENGFLSKGE